MNCQELPYVARAEDLPAHVLSSLKRGQCDAALLPPVEAGRFLLLGLCQPGRPTGFRLSTEAHAALLPLFEVNA